ncbi:MAG: ABC transporter permease [Candidatus Omnitrophica bacterium CG11_big_fil_rev_8_21_14_0_20_42_13]|uniref:ABC transporter permease n=1 Tax=Candidatus Ghiorseimicrobium undicola TaxID=1974746 RepID=A0A2H0LY56_9BACT|nr:MAG: ABC transporter permease [Candidatus Omnitrophica bacterium CG11_big_fil_rev_8_21_14_0_20_42_13]
MRKSRSQFRLALSHLKRSRASMISLFILLVLYAAAIFTDFIVPYAYDDEERLFSYAPPSRVHFFDDAGKLRPPFIYAKTIELDEYRRRVYREDKEKIYPLKFFAKREKYKFLFLFGFDRCLLGVDKPARIYLWGADSRGRDIFSRLIYGSRISLTIGLIGVSISFLIGLIIGGISGFYGGGLDNFLMRLTEMVMMIPTFYLMLSLRAAFPPGLSSAHVYLMVVFILSFVGWPGLARVIRGMSLSLREREYVLAAKTLGVSDIKIILRHILPHCSSYAIINAALAIPAYILGETALSLLGLGIQDPMPSWGNMLSEAMNIVQIRFYPWVLLPGLFIFAVVMAFNLLADGLRDALDPLFKK